MKIFKVKCQDGRPDIRVKVLGNAFVEVYHDKNGFFYGVDVPGLAKQLSSARFRSQNEALRKGEIVVKSLAK